MDQAEPPIAPGTIRYIKLGAGGRWEAAALDGDRIEWGHSDDPHALALAGDWTAARAHYLAAGMTAGNATDATRSLKEFYTLGPETLWITFARGYLWWAYAEAEVVDRGDQTVDAAARFRRTIGPWRNTDICGRPLHMHALSTRLTQLAAYRRTICTVGEADYLWRRINTVVEPVVAGATHARDALVASVAELIRLLHWADFELFVDLVFSRAGWRRLSLVGGTMKDIDLLVEQPVTGELISVQVKSKADQATLDACVAAFATSRQANRFFFVTHSSRGTLAIPATLPADLAGRVHLWTVDALSRKAVDAGLTDWLIARSA